MITIRRQLALLVAATTSVILIAFIVPLCYLVQQVAADRAINAATREAEGLAPIVATVDRSVVELALSQLAHDDPSDYPLTVFYADSDILGAPAQRTKAVDLAARGRSVVADADGGREILVAVQGLDDGTAVIRGFVTDADMREGVIRAWLILGGLGIVLLAVSIGLADRLAHRLVQPMIDLAKVSHQLGAGELDARVDPAGPMELRGVGQAVNQLADRIAVLLATERESVADLSHRLRTPLTVLRLDADALTDPADADRIGRDVDTLTRTVDDVISEARRPVREGIAARSDATAVVAERLDFWAPLAEEEGRAVVTDVPAHPLHVRVAGPDLAATLDALLGNIFAHTPAGTAFAVRLTETTEGDALLTIRDQGPGFDTANPMDRGASSKGSTGLGLDIARRTAEAAGGSLTIGAPTSTAEGAEITLVLSSARSGGQRIVKLSSTSG